MESVDVDEDPGHLGEVTAEEMESSVVRDPSSIDKCEKDKSSGDSFASSVVDSVKSTLKSAAGLLPASLGGEAKDHSEGAEGPSVSDEVIDSHVEKDAQLPRALIGNEPSRADAMVVEESSLEGNVTDGAAEGWSVVDPFPQDVTEDEAQFQAQSARAEGEKEVHGSGNPNAIVHENEQSVNEDTSQSSPSTITAEREIEEQQSNTSTSPSGYVADSPFVRSSSSLRRRPRSFSKGRKHDAVKPAEDDVFNSVDASSSWFVESGDISAMAENEAFFQPQNCQLSGASGATEEVGSQPENEDSGGSVSKVDNYSNDLTPRKKTEFRSGSAKDGVSMDASSSWFAESGDISALAENEAFFQPQNCQLSGASGATGEVGSQPENEDSGGSVSKVDNYSNDLTPRKKSEFRSGSDPELGEDGSSVSSRETEGAQGMEVWRRRRSQPEEGWEEISSASDVDGNVPPLIPAETRPQRREVYRVPGTADADGGQGNRGESPTQLLAQPAGFIVGAVEFQLKLIVHVVAIGIWLFNFTLATLSHPISRTVAVRDRVSTVTTGAATQLVDFLSVFGEGVSQAGPTVSNLSKRTFWGCLSVAYVICMLGLLLIPALFLDIVIVNSVVQKPVVIRQALHFDYTQPKPVALLPLFPLKEVERIKSLPLDKILKPRVIPLGNKFHVTVVLTLPESDYNMKLGMFQVTAELLSARDQVIMRSSKPCRIRFRSLPIQLVKTLIYAVPHMVGLSKEAQTIEIRLLEAQEKMTPSASVRILIEPKASFSDGGGVPEIYEAAVVVESSLPWPQAIMSSWKWLFFVWNGLCLFLFEVSIVLCCCRGAIIPSFGRKAIAGEDIVQGEVKEEMEAMKGSSRKARSNRRVSFEDDTHDAADATQDRRVPRTLKKQEKADGAGGMVEDKFD